MATNSPASGPLPFDEWELTDEKEAVLATYCWSSAAWTSPKEVAGRLALRSTGEAGLGVAAFDDEDDIRL